MNKENTFFEDWQNLVDSFDKLYKTENNPFFKSKYVPLKDILPVVKKHCKKNNFIFFQVPKIVEGKNALSTTFMHKGGEKVEGMIELVAKDEKDPQKLGGAVTYMRRYSLTCMLGLEEADDDGNNSAGNIQKSTQVNLGTCSICGTPMVKGQWGLYCPNKKTKHPNETGYANAPVNDMQTPF